MPPIKCENVKEVTGKRVCVREHASNYQSDDATILYLTLQVDLMPTVPSPQRHRESKHAFCNVQIV